MQSFFNKRFFAFAALVLVPSVIARSTLSCDSQGKNCFQQVGIATNDLTIGLALPPASSEHPTTEFIARFEVSRENYGFAGVSIDGANFTLLAGWAAPNTEKYIVTARVVKNKSLVPVQGPKFTLLHGAEGNATHLTNVFRCQNCLNSPIFHPNIQSKAAPISLVISSFMPEPHADQNAPIKFNSSNYFPVVFNFSGARVDDYFSRLTPSNQ